MFCPHCGATLREGAKFCENCGSPLETVGAEVPRERVFHEEDPGYGIAPGFSRRIGSEEVLRALKKQRRVSRIAALVVIPLPLIGFAIYGTVSDSMEMWQAIFSGVVVSFIFALTMLIVGIKRRLTKPFEGTVAKMKTTYSSRGSYNGGVARTRYWMWFDCDDGKRRKKEVTRYIFDYLMEGDRVRYLPQFPQPCEKYDKSHDSEVMCMFCGRMQDIRQDTCSHCKNPLIK